MTNVYLLYIINGHGDSNWHQPFDNLKDAVGGLFDFVADNWSAQGMGALPDPITWDDQIDFFGDTSLFPEIIHIHSIGVQLRSDRVTDTEMRIALP